MLLIFLGVMVNALPPPEVAVLIRSEGDVAVGTAVARTLADGYLRAQAVRVDGWLKGSGPSCSSRVNCLCRAPGVGRGWAIDLRVRPLRAGTVIADVRVLDCASGGVRARSSATVPREELIRWSSSASQRMLRDAGAAGGPLPAASLLRQVGERDGVGAPAASSADEPVQPTSARGAPPDASPLAPTKRRRHGSGTNRVPVGAERE